MSPVIDQAVTWRKVEERLEVETDPILRRNLETVLAHMKAESAGDIDGLLDTLADDVHYHAYGAPDPASSPVGKDGVRGVLRALRRVGRRTAAARHRPAGRRPRLHPHRGRHAHGVPGPHAAGDGHRRWTTPTRTTSTRRAWRRCGRSTPTARCSARTRTPAATASPASPTASSTRPTSWSSRRNACASHPRRRVGDSTSSHDFPGRRPLGLIEGVVMPLDAVSLVQALAVRRRREGHARRRSRPRRRVCAVSV